jgi:hypothetical protein
MPSPYPPIPYQLETALLVTLRDTFPWESSVAPLNSSGTYSGTLNTFDPAARFSAAEYQRRDRELAWMDTRNAAAVVQVSLEVSDVWLAGATRPIMQGAQVAHLNVSPQDTSAAGLLSKVVHVTHASLPVDALQVDRDLTGRDLLIYDTLYAACNNLFVPSPIESAFQGTNGEAVTYAGAPAPAGTIPGVTAWSFAHGTARPSDIATALPMNRDLFRDPDMNLADRDNQMAGYVATLCQMLKNPFSYADRLYVAVNGVDSREAEVYTLIYPQFVAGQLYYEGDEVYYQDVCYRVKTGVGSTSDVPWTSPWAWETTTAPQRRIWAGEPALPNRNRFVYDTTASTLQWFREQGSETHVPQLVALSIPGIFSGQTLQTLAQVPGRKDGQYWRGKAAKVVPAGGTYTPIYGYDDTASWKAYAFTPQLTGASMLSPTSGTVTFPDPTTSLSPTLLQPGWYRLHALVEPNSLVEIAGASNTAALDGTLGGVTFGATEQVTWELALPAGAWTVEFDYTNLTGSTEGYRIKADLGGTPVFDDTSPFYFNDAQGAALPNGQLATSVPFPMYPSGGKQALTFDWTGGGGDLHIRTLRFKSSDFTEGRYHITGTMAGSMASVDVVGANRQPDVLAWDFYVRTATSSDVLLSWQRDSELPLRFLRFDLAQYGTNSPTPNVQGFEPYRQDCLWRAVRSAQQAFSESLATGTEAPVFMSAGSHWGTEATERWMAHIEVAEPRLRQVDNVTSGSLVEGRSYQAKLQPLTYYGNTIVADQVFTATGSLYTWVSTAGTVNQVGAWSKGRASDVGRPALTPAGVYWDTNGGTVAVAYGPERNQPELASMQPWMIRTGFYAAQPEFLLPPNV